MAELTRTPPYLCGLALALPLHLNAVERALTGGPFADYVGRGAALGGAAALWAGGFQEVAAAAQKLAEDASRLGVLVCENATLRDLSYLFSARQVVTVVAHWRGPQISTEDLLENPNTVAHRLAQEDSEIPVLIRAGLDSDWQNWLRTADTDTARRSRLAELLDRRMSKSPPIRRPPVGTEWHMDPITLRHENRSALDLWWPQAFKPGNRLELADGLHTPEAIGAVVPESWTGVTDLSNCQSAQLINAIKRHRDDRVVIANEQETDPRRRLTLLTVIYDLLSEAEITYVDARAALAAKMREQRCPLRRVNT